MIALGSGPPVVMVPGLQGRWEWQRPALEALARRCRTVTYSLCGEPGTECRLSGQRGFDSHVDQLDRLLDRVGLDRVALCGVSYGGWVSVRYAALRPERVSALVLASTPGPGFQPDLRQMRYVRTPYLLLPAFIATTRLRLRPEVLAAMPDARERWRLTRHQLTAMARAPISPSLMARRIRLAMEQDFVADCARVQAPTLVLTGEHGLDRVVPVESTREYLSLIRGAVGAEVERTGHIGLITKPRVWADMVCDFVEANAAEGTGALAPEPEAAASMFQGDGEGGTN